MKEILYQLAKQLTQYEITQDEANEKIISSQESLDWNEVASEIEQQCQQKSFGNNLLFVIQKHSEILEKTERLEKLELIYNQIQNSNVYQGLSSLATTIGNLHRDTGNFEKAIPYFESSRRMLQLLDEELLNSDEEVSFVPSEDGIAIEDTDMSSPISKMALPPVKLNQTSTDDSLVLDRLEEELQQARQHHDKITQNDILIKIGEYHYRQKNLDKASNIWHECLMISKETEYIENIIQSYGNLGRVAIDHREIEEASSLLSFAIDGLKSLKDCIPQINDTKKYKDIFHSVVTSCLSKSDFEKALYYTEYARKWLYSANIEESVVIEHSKAPADLKSNYIQLLQQNHALYQELLRMDENFTHHVESLKKNLPILKKLRHDIGQQDPQWDEKFGRGFDFDIAKLQQKIDSSTVLVEFLITDKGMYVFIVDGNSVDAFLIPELTHQYLTDLYEPILTIEKFLQLWSKWCIEKSYGSQESFQAISDEIAGYGWKNAYEAQNSWKVQLGLATKKIAEAILPELVSRIESRTQTINRLILVPEGILQLYPLHLMQIEGANFQVYLQDRYEVIYAPTALTFSECAHGTVNQEYKIVIAHCTQQNIPFMREEIRIMNRIWPGEINFQLGANSTLENFKSNLEQASHIHLAVHSKNVYPKVQNSSILLADRQVFIHDILGYISKSNINAITFSANERNIDNLDDFGDLMGLHWALLKIGVKNVVAPMWTVPDIATFFVTEKFYHGLGQGLSPAMALQEAQNELRTMTINDIIERIKMQQKLSNERGATWLSNLCDFLIDSGKVTFDEKKNAIATLQTNRNMIQFEGKPIKVQLSDFISDANGSIPGEKEFEEKNFRPFSHPFYWGAFYCTGVGLTGTYLADDDSEEEYYQMAEAVAEENVEEASVAEEIQEDSHTESGKDQKSPFDHVKIRATCPHCGTNIHCFLPMANKTAKCPRCKLKVKIPKREVLLTEIAAGDQHSSVLLING
ncbi:CHAT domain-containing protein [Candidatus Uabimicrobium helgolandensis]